MGHGFCRGPTSNARPCTECPGAVWGVIPPECVSCCAASGIEMRRSKGMRILTRIQDILPSLNQSSAAHFFVNKLFYLDSYHLFPVVRHRLCWRRSEFEDHNFSDTIRIYSSRPRDFRFGPPDPD